MDRTICRIPFSRCWTMSELSATKLCSWEDAKSYNDDTDLTMLSWTKDRGVCVTFSLWDSRSSFSRFLAKKKRQLPHDFSIIRNVAKATMSTAMGRSQMSTFNLSRLNMTATTKEELLSYCCIRYIKMSLLIPNLSKQNQILTKLTGTISQSEELAKPSKEIFCSLVLIKFSLGLR